MSRGYILDIYVCTYLPLIIMTLLATVFSIAWYKIVVQPFLVVYRGLYPSIVNINYDPSKENCMIFRKVTGFRP